MSRRNIKIAKQLVRIAKELVASRNVTAELNKPDQLKAFWDCFSASGMTSKGLANVEGKIAYFVQNFQNAVTAQRSFYDRYIDSVNAEISKIQSIAADNGGNLSGQLLTQLRNYMSYYTKLDSFVTVQTDANGDFLESNKRKGPGMHSTFNKPLEDIVWDSSLRMYVPSGTAYEGRNPNNLSLPNAIQVRTGIDTYFHVLTTMLSNLHGQDQMTIPHEEFVQLDVPALNQLKAKMYIAVSQKRTTMQLHEAVINSALLGGKTFSNLRVDLQSMALKSFKKLQGLLVDANNRVIAFCDTISMDKDQLDVITDNVNQAIDKAKQQEETNPALFDKNHPNGIDPADPNVYVGSSRIASRRRQAGLVKWLKTNVVDKFKGIFAGIKQKWEEFVAGLRSIKNDFKVECDNVNSINDKIVQSINDNTTAINQVIYDLTAVLDKIIAEDSPEHATGE